jgi:4-amino-4-deoxy-L-arabinose transferase-like glycosyltransferase
VAERLRRVPPALGALLAVSLLLAVVWACLTPAFQAPDEQRHFSYVESLGARFALPGAPGQRGQSSQLLSAMAAVNSNQVAAQLPVKPEWSQAAERAWRPIDAAAPRDDGGGVTPASTYPPTAYAWQALGYLAGTAGSLYDELLGARLMSALWLPVTVLATWLLAGELVGRRRLLQTTAAAVPALLPMVAFITASSSPDGMLYALWTLALWVGVRCIRHGLRLAELAVFLALTALACSVKATSFALLPAAAFLGVLIIAKRRPRRLPRRAALAAAVALPVALVVGVWLLVSAAGDTPGAAQIAQSTSSVSPRGTNWREFLSYLWQYYLPRVPGQQDFSIPAIQGGFPLLRVWIVGTWGAFGWLEVQFPLWVYKLLGVLTGALAAGAVVALARGRHRLDLRVAAFLALACGALIAGLHWTDYHQIKDGLGFMQGRYLFPLIGLIGVALAGVVSLFPDRRRPSAAGVAVAALLGFHVLCLGLVLERFYA